MALKAIRIEQAAAASGALAYAAANAFLAAGLGAFGRPHGLDEAEAGLVLAVGAVAGVLFAPIWGYGSERFGRRRLLLLASVVMTLAPLAMALIFASTWPTVALVPALVVARALLSTGGAGLVPLAQANVADTATSERRLQGMGAVSFALSLGTLLGSLLLSVVDRTGVILGLLSLLAVGALSTVIIWVWVPDRGRPQAETSDVAIEMDAVWPFLAITFSGFLAYGMVVPLIGLRFIDILGMSPEGAAAAAGMVLTVTSVALALSHASVALVGGFGFSAMLIAGCMSGAGAFLLLTLSADVGSTAFAMALIGLTLGQAGPANNAALSLVAGALAQGKAAGLNAAARNLGLAVGPLIGGLLYQQSIALPFHVAALMLIFTALLAMLGRRSLARRSVT